MPWTDKDTEALRTYRDIINSDDILIKEKIKKILLNNRFLIHVLNNSELDEDEPDSYYGVNILPFYMITPTQTNVQNFVTFSTQTTELERYNKRMKYMQIVFTVLCESKNIIDKDTYIARHDLLAAILIDTFNWTNYFGAKIHCVSNKELIVDNSYAAREIIFEQITDNNTAKTVNGVTRNTDKDVIVLGKE